MKNFTAKILLFLAGIVLATIAFPPRNQQAQIRRGGSAKEELPKLLPKHSALPPIARFDEPSVPQDPKEQARRQSRDRVSKGLYTHKVILDPGVREIYGQAESIDLTFIDGVMILKPGEREDPIGLPINSSIILIGTVTSGKAYVNQEHTGVFSEYRVTVQEVLKPDPQSVISAQDEIITWEGGGSLQFESGHITHFIIGGRGFPEIRTQYVLFLRRPDETVKDYAINTAYSIKDQVVSPMDGAEYPRSPFDGMPLKEFLDKLRHEISIRQEGGND